MRENEKKASKYQAGVARFEKGLIFMYGSENLIVSSPVRWIFFAVTAILGFLEYKLPHKWLWITLTVLAQTAAVTVLLFAGAMLSEFLLYVLAVLFIRLCYIMLERRKAV